jgi:hypothetical protein
MLYVLGILFEYRNYSLELLDLDWVVCRFMEFLFNKIGGLDDVYDSHNTLLEASHPFILLYFLYSGGSYLRRPNHG